MRISSVWILSLCVVTLSACSLVQPNSRFSSDKRPHQTPLASPMVTPSPLPTAVCNLVTKSAIEAVVGQTLNDPQQSKVIDEGGVTKQSCLWTAANGEYAPTISITIIRVGTPETVADQMATAAAEVTASAVARQWQAEKNKTQTQARFETINNLGEAAYSNATGVHVLAADQALTVLVSLKSSGSNRSVAEQLARQIVPLLQ